MLSRMQRRAIMYSIVGVVIVASIGVYVAASNPFMEKPWQGMSCEEMLNLAMSPEHQTFSQAQHLEFHKDLMPCIEEQGSQQMGQHQMDQQSP